MKKVLLGLLLLVMLVYPAFGMTFTADSAEEITISKIWSTVFHGEPNTNVAILDDTNDLAIIGTSLGVVAINSSGVVWVKHIGSVIVDPVTVGEKIFVAGSEKLYSFSASGSKVDITIPGIKALAKWGNSIVVNSVSGEKSTLYVYDYSSLEPKIDINIDYIAYYLAVGDFDGDGEDDLVTVSVMGNVSVFDTNGNVLTSVNLNLSYGESIGMKPILGDLDGDDEYEIIIPVTPLRRGNVETRLEVLDGSNIVELNLSSRAYALGVYDFDNDGKQDIFVGSSTSYFAVDFPTNNTLFEVSTIGSVEGFQEVVYINDVDKDDEGEILYLSGKGSMVLANSSGIEKVFTVTNEYLYTFAVGNFAGTSEDQIIVVTTAGTVKIVNMASWDIYSECELIGGLLGGVHPIIFDGMGAIPLTNKKIMLINKSGIMGYIGTYNIFANMIYADTDGDGLDEGIFVDYSDGVSEILSITEKNISTLYTTNGTVYGISAGDIDFDGKDEIILNLENKIVVFGSVEWTLNMTEFLVRIPPAVYDVDNDLKLEIVVMSQEGATYLIASNGTIEGRFDVSVLPEIPIAVGDINYDRGADFLVYQSGSLYSVDLDGKILFMISKEEIYTDPHPIITDIDADGFLDIIVASGKNITIYDHMGEEKKTINFDKYVSGFTVLDIGEDWIQDIIVALPGEIAIKNLVTGDDVSKPLALDIVGDKADILAGDFDNDEKTEIVVISSGVAYLEISYNSRGSSMCAGINKMATYNTLNYDRDEDLLTDYEEMMIYGTNPYLRDTDGDGFDDRTELINGWDPLDSGSPQRFPVFWLSLILSVIVLAVILYMYLWRPKERK
ncbi:MAG: hypothetical protein Q6363_007650 [Candidatus Njordarchaeota archaeon]